VRRELELEPAPPAVDDDRLVVERGLVEEDGKPLAAAEDGCASLDVAGDAMRVVRVGERDALAE